MVTDNHYRWDFIQLADDPKPTPATSPKVTNGSTLYTSDDSKLYVWYNDQWYEKTSTGGGGTTDYNNLSNQPKVNNVTLTGNKTSNDLGLQAKLVSGINIKTINSESILGSGDITIQGGTGGEIDILRGTWVSDTVFNDPDGNPYTPDATKVYLDTTTDKYYRYDEDTEEYVEVALTLTIGETAGTAYEGNKGKKNADTLNALTQYAHSYNVFDIANVNDGYFLSTTTGDLTGNPNYFTTDYIPVEVGKILTASYNGASAVNMRFGVVYDSTKTMISGATWSSNQSVYPKSGQTVPENAAYIRVSVSKQSQPADYMAKFMLEWTDSGTISPYTPYRNDLQIKESVLPDDVQALPTRMDGLESDIVTLTSTQNTIEGEVNGIVGADYQTISSYERYNAATSTSGYYVNEANGKLAASASYTASDYIPIENGHHYAFQSHSSHWACYDSTKTFITAPTTESAGSYKYFTATADGYIRISANLAQNNLLFFEVADKTQATFLPYAIPSYVTNLFYNDVTIPKDKKEDFSFYLYNLIDPAKIAVGKFGDTTNANYDTTDFIPLPAVPIAVYKQNLTKLAMRQVEYFDRDLIKIYSEASPSTTLTTTPTFVQPKYIRITAETGALANAMTFPEGLAPVEFLDYGEKIIRKSYIEPYLAASDAKVEALKGTNRLITTSANLASGDSLTLPDFPQHLKKNTSLTGDMKFSTFTGVKIGWGFETYRGDWLEIDDTNIVHKHFEGSTSTVSTVAHGLTIKDSLSLMVYIDNDGVCNISMATNGGNNTYTMQWTHEQNGVAFLTGSQAMTDVELSGVALDAKCPIWLFGDSFFGFSDNRVMGQLQNLGFTDNVLVDGMGGVGTSAALADINRLIALGGSPKIIICCEGMNDNGELYSQNLPGIISACESVDAELVLYKVPVCASRLTENTGVNAVVLASGKRYVDANRAVGSNAEGVWWDGYNADGIHPTVLGAKAIAQRIVIDVPEIMQYGKTEVSGENS